MTDIIVVGGGPAGLTAALYAARAGRTVQVIEEGAPGGQIVYAPLVENYPGLPNMSGGQFAQSLTDQAQGLGVELAYTRALSADREGEDWVVSCEDGPHTCRALVLAPGAQRRRLGLPGEEALTGCGLSYCAVCDGPFYQNGHVAVVGGGDTALRDALFLANLCAKVTLIHRRREFRAEAALAAQVAKLPNVELLLGWTVEELLAQGETLTGLRLRAVSDGEERTLTVDGAFIAVGQQPGTAPFATLVEPAADGCFPAGEDCTTPRPGLFVAGDCRTKQVRQLTTAVADGAVAGLAAAHFVGEGYS